MVKSKLNIFHFSKYLLRALIRIDDSLLQDITEEAYRKNSIFLFQDFEKYFFTVEENMVTGELMNDKTIADVKKAAHLSVAGSFIERVSRGYQTRTGRIFEGSEQLSGGHIQALHFRNNFMAIRFQMPVS